MALESNFGLQIGGGCGAGRFMPIKSFHPVGPQKKRSFHPGGHYLYYFAYIHFFLLRNVLYIVIVIIVVSSLKINIVNNNFKIYKYE